MHCKGGVVTHPTRTDLSGTLAIVADDFTGACDAGVQFAKRSFPTTVSLSPTHLYTAKRTAEIVIQDTETRNETYRMAKRRLHSFAQNCLQSKVNLIYKKIDSTLRGNLGAELEAILDVFKDRAVVVAPTYPEYQRTTVNGILLVRGTPLDKTEFVRGLLKPMKHSSIGAIISSQCSRPTLNIRLATVRRGSASIAKALRRSRSKGVRIFYVDAEDRSDLRRIAVACRLTQALPCGSAGLAEEIAKDMVPDFRKPVLVISASTSNATMKEIRDTRARTECALIAANAIGLFESDAKRRHEIKRIRRLTHDALNSSRNVIISSARSKGDVTRALHVSGPSPSARRRVGRAIVTGLTEATFPLAKSNLAGAIVLTGGEMTAAFLNQAHVEAVRLQTEIVPGVALGTIVRGPLNGLRVVTKAGGFGLPGSLAQIIRYLGSHD
jgi:uncharacterized protein YgbK (DUF1537 family)